MEIKEAVKLIEKGVSKETIQSWADLGAGSGLFTKALSTLLPEGSSIVAIDKKVLKIDGPGITTRTSNFLDLDFENADGVVMANSLHYVKDHEDFLQKLSAKTKRLILVEYNTDRANQWVPYPISFNKLKTIYPDAKQIGEHSSQYHSAGMYSALILF
jgi:ubiquinone/menaquinone biosynthesis C-methylase UbiE